MIPLVYRSMLVQKESNPSKLELENSNAYSNFVNSINSDQTRKIWILFNTILKTSWNEPWFIS